jgi:hypothetical protein
MQAACNAMALSCQALLEAIIAASDALGNKRSSLLLLLQAMYGKSEEDLERSEQVRLSRESSGD